MSHSSRPLLKKSDYFDDDDDDFNQISASVSKAMGRNSQDSVTPSTLDDEEEEDPLDAFMRSNEVEVLKASTTVSEPLPEIVSQLDSDDDNDESVEDQPQDAVDYDSDGIPIGKVGKVRVEPLPPVDHSRIVYPHVDFNFYREHSDVHKMSEEAVEERRHALQLTVTGSDAPRPVNTFAELGLPPKLLEGILKVGFETPTAVQSQAIPMALSGRDVIALAKTGSGKTFAFVWPIIVHVLDQPMMESGDGPIALVLAPTRELCVQIYTEAKRFCRLFNMQVCAIFGGGGKYEMKKALQQSPEVVVATPGRLIDMVASKATRLHRVTMVVLDEADRMFEMGFEYQMRSILNNVRPPGKRQTLLFSATMKKRVESFAREILRNPLRLLVGGLGQANPDIRQEVTILSDASHKWRWLVEAVETYVSEGKILVFVGSRADTDELAAKLNAHFSARQLLIGLDCIHGDRSQEERSEVLRRFRSGAVRVLVATDVAARGLDVKDIRVVVNYETPKNIEAYVHRIGRTGRMGVDGVTPGTAFTLLTNKDATFASELVRNLRLSGQTVTEELARLAAVGGGGSRGWSSKGPTDNRGRGGIGTASVGPAVTSGMLATQSVPVPVSKGETSGSKRKSRFAQVDEETTATGSVGVAAPTLSGFVRGSQSYSSISSSTSHRPSTSSQQQLESAPKRSRWEDE